MEIYQYRAYIKDQLSLTAKPKAFLVTTSFTIRNDLLTNANSQITVKEIQSNINNGDILVLYTPFGDKVYQGVITKVENKTIQCSQMQHYFNGLTVAMNYPSTYIETELQNLLNQYATGHMYNSTYVDPLVAQRFSGLTINKVDSTLGQLPTYDSKKTINYESFIYQMYQDYGIVFDFEINYQGANTVTIKVPNSNAIKVSNNNNVISNLSPTTTIEETNRLVIYANDGTYRKTYIAKTDGSIVQEPSSTALRFNVTNTKIVFSDDELDTLVKANLPSQMYNHKVTFNLVVDNKLYDYKDFKLGNPIEIFKDGNYFNSILTGVEFSKQSNQNIAQIKYTCGKVRTNLTNLLTLGKVG